MKTLKFAVLACVCGLLFVSFDVFSARRSGNAEDCPCWDPEGAFNGLFQALSYLDASPDYSELLDFSDRGTIVLDFEVWEPLDSSSYDVCATGVLAFFPADDEYDYPICWIQTGMRVTESQCSWSPFFWADKLTGPQTNGCIAAFQMMFDQIAELKE